VHKKPVEVDFGAILSTELSIHMSMGYPTEIFEVTRDIIAAGEKYAQIISDRVPFDRVQDALKLATTPGAADKVVVTFPAGQPPGRWPNSTGTRTVGVVHPRHRLDRRQGDVATILLAWGQLERRRAPMFVNLINGLVGLLAALRPVTVQAHCDTAEGPAVTDGRKALETGNINHALKWISADGESELRDVFEKAMKVRTLGAEAPELADRLFLETMVRLHRMGEGVGFAGIQPVGTQVDPVVAAAAEAIAQGSDAALLPMVPPERRAELDQRFQAALAVKDFDVDDVAAGRRYLAAYVSFFKYAEGEDHEHHGHEHHGHEH
jgi:hypothetical protein